MTSATRLSRKLSYSNQSEMIWHGNRGIKSNSVVLDIDKQTPAGSTFGDLGRKLDCLRPRMRFDVSQGFRQNLRNGFR